MCIHAQPFKGGCRAYPKGIPMQFSDGSEDHSKVEPDQIGKYVFEKGEPYEITELKKTIKK